MSIARGDKADNVAANRNLFFCEMGMSESEIAQGVQVSRDGIKIVNSPGRYAASDALITQEANVYLAVLTADCSPILIWSQDKPLVAAVHSGWQGSELNILGQTLEKMRDELAVNPQSIHVTIGPGLTAENFEVGLEFQDKFPLEYLSRGLRKGKFFFDNNRYLKATALDVGVLEKNIEILPYCSFRDEELFFSHRRDKVTTGRMLSVIGICK